MFNILVLVKKIKGKINWYLFGGKKRARKFVLQRVSNQKHCFDFPAELNGWRKIGRSPVYGNLTTGSIFDPFVFSHDSIFFMAASERKTGNLILLRSGDGKKVLLRHGRILSIGLVFCVLTMFGIYGILAKMDGLAV